MFDHPGRKLKKWAKFLFIVMIIASLILAIVFRNGFNPGYHEEFDPVTFFGFLLLCPILGYIVCLMLYGFGELIENSGKSDETKKQEEQDELKAEEE